MRTASATDFTITLPEVGDFTFGSRTMGDMIKIRSAYLKMIGENAGDDEMEFFCGFAATYQVLLVACPVGCEDAANLDLNKFGAGKVQELARLISEKEASFRLQPSK